MREFSTGFHRKSPKSRALVRTLELKDVIENLKYQELDSNY